MGKKQLMLQEPIRELHSLQVGEKVFVIVKTIRSLATVAVISKNAILTECGIRFSIKTGNSYRKTEAGPNYLIIPTHEELRALER